MVVAAGLLVYHDRTRDLNVNVPEGLLVCHDSNWMVLSVNVTSHTDLREGLGKGSCLSGRKEWSLCSSAPPEIMGKRGVQHLPECVWTNLLDGMQPDPRGGGAMWSPFPWFGGRCRLEDHLFVV